MCDYVVHVRRIPIRSTCTTYMCDSVNIHRTCTAYMYDSVNTALECRCYEACAERKWSFVSERQTVINIVVLCVMQIKMCTKCNEVLDLGLTYTFALRFLMTNKQSET